MHSTCGQQRLNKIALSHVHTSWTLSMSMNSWRSNSSLLEIIVLLSLDKSSKLIVNTIIAWTFIIIVCCRLQFWSAFLYVAVIQFSDDVIIIGSPAWLRRVNGDSRSNAKTWNFNHLPNPHLWINWFEILIGWLRHAFQQPCQVWWNIRVACLLFLFIYSLTRLQPIPVNRF